MKYEDGEIVTIEGEESTKPIDVNLGKNASLPKQDLNDIGNVQPNIDKVNIKDKLLNSKLIKTITSIVVFVILILFIATLNNLYKTFKTEPQKDTTKVISEQKDNVKTSNSNDTKPTITNNGKTDDENTQTQNESSLQLSLRLANTTNTVLANVTIREIRIINEFINNKSNRLSAENSVKSSLELKKQLYLQLSEKRAEFEKEGILDYYKVTEERLLNSIKLSNESVVVLENWETKDKLTTILNSFMDTESSIKKRQDKELIRLLDIKKIQYKLNAVTQEIEFVIK